MIPSKVTTRDIDLVYKRIKELENNKPTLATVKLSFYNYTIKL